MISLPVRRACCAALTALATAACAGPTAETVVTQGGEGQSYVLVSIDGAPFPARATISFPGPLQVRGNGPCNSYRGGRSVPLPGFGTTALAVTRRACPDLRAEGAFFAALAAMTAAEVDGTTLILSAPGIGRSMVFQAE